MSLNEWFQTVLLVVAAWTVWEITRGNLLKGAIVGLVSEFFWFGTSYTSGQWSIFILTFWYTWCYGKVVYNHYNK